MFNIGFNVDLCENNFIEFVKNAIDELIATSSQNKPNNESEYAEKVSLGLFEKATEIALTTRMKNALNCNELKMLDHDLLVSQLFSDHFFLDGYGYPYDLNKKLANIIKHLCFESKMAESIWETYLLYASKYQLIFSFSAVLIGTDFKWQELGTYQLIKKTEI